MISSKQLKAELPRRADDGSWPETPERVPADADLTLASVAFTIAPRDIYRTTTLAGTRTL